MTTELDTTTECHRWPNHLYFAFFETLKAQDISSMAILRGLILKNQPEKRCSDFPDFIHGLLEGEHVVFIFSGNPALCIFIQGEG